MSRKLLAIVAIYLTSVVLMALQKPLFLLWYAEQAAEASSAELLGVSLNGLLLDSTVAGYISAIPWLIMLVAEWVAIPEKAMRRVLNTYFVIIALIASLMVAVDFGLFRYWGFRQYYTALPRNTQRGSRECDVERFMACRIAICGIRGPYDCGMARSCQNLSLGESESSTSNITHYNMDCCRRPYILGYSWRHRYGSR